MAAEYPDAYDVHPAPVDDPPDPEKLYGPESAHADRLSRLQTLARELDDLIDWDQEPGPWRAYARMARVSIGEAIEAEARGAG